MRRRQMMQKVSRISLCVVIGLLFLALIWKFAGAQLAKKGIVLSNDTAAKTVSETAPEAEDGSGNAGIKKLAETTPPNETPGWQYSSSGWWYATDATTYYVNGWADIDGNQYHFDSNGYMATGWKAIGGKGCYFDDQGVYQPDRNGSMMVALTFDDGPRRLYQHASRYAGAVRGTGDVLYARQQCGKIRCRCDPAHGGDRL